MKMIKLFLLFFIFISQISTCFSMDVIRWNHGNVATDKRRDYKADLITQVLEKTTPIYGAYRIVEADQGLVPLRAIQQLQAGETINIFMAVTSPEWEEKTIPIRIPIRRGILNYRLLATNKDKLPTFAKVESERDFRQFTAGLRRGWATVSLMESYGYKMQQTTTLDGLYNMLLRHRIDYIPRGINEIFDEIKLQNEHNSSLVLEPTLAIYTQAPYYIFVSPKAERLAKRLEAGLEMMIADNSLKALFYKYYAQSIVNAKLDSRKIIRIENTNLSSKTPLNRKELWFEND